MVFVKVMETSISSQNLSHKTNPLAWGTWCHSSSLMVCHQPDSNSWHKDAARPGPQPPRASGCQCAAEPPSQRLPVARRHWQGSCRRAVTVLGPQPRRWQSLASCPWSQLRVSRPRLLIMGGPIFGSEPEAAKLETTVTRQWSRARGLGDCSPCIQGPWGLRLGRPR